MATQTEGSEFFMYVDTELKEQFRAACGMAPMSAVTRELWRQYINRMHSDGHNTTPDHDHAHHKD
jgi:hypothetical protein